MDTIKDKYIWIIGASSGIGEALAYELASRGAHVAISARSGEKLDVISHKLQGDKHLSLPLDVTDLEGFDKSLEAIGHSFPKLDSVIFLAAHYTPHKKEREPIASIHAKIDVNLKGAINVVEKVYPVFKKQGYGQVVLCGSVAGYRGLAYGQPYCATKAAIINYAESLKIEAEPDNIDVKLISPGFVKTQLTDKNDFKMPMIISAERAGREIADGLTRKPFEIHFPKKFTFWMKILRLLPTRLYFAVSRKMQDMM